MESSANSRVETDDESAIHQKEILQNQLKYSLTFDSNVESFNFGRHIAFKLKFQTNAVHTSTTVVVFATQ